MRALGALLLYLGVLAAFAGGGALAATGLTAQHTENAKYDVQFKYQGDECEAGSLAVDASDGKPLSCGLAGVTPLGPPEFKIARFTAAQDAQVLKLSTNLGTDGFTLPEEQQLTDRVHQLADALPQEHGWFWGAREGWTGVVLFVLAVLTMIGLRIRTMSDA